MPEVASQTAERAWKLESIIRRLPFSTTFVKFLIVGGIGFLINQSMLFLLYDTSVFWFFPEKGNQFGLGPITIENPRLLLSSVLAVETAIVFQFTSHERWTFRRRDRRGWGPLRFLKFNLTSAASPIIAVAITYTFNVFLGISPYIGNTVGVLIGFMWNWAWNTLVIWPKGEGA